MINFITFKPNISVVGDKLVACTGFLDKLFTLFSYIKQVTVDRSIKAVTIEKRVLWFFTSEKIISFDDIKSITYIYYKDSYQTDVETDEFKVSIELINPPKRINLVTFRGNDGVVFRGDQEDSSRSYLELLMAFTGKKLNRRA